MRAFDLFLLDHLFQPIVNRLAKHPGDVTMNVAMGASVMSIAPNLVWLFLSGWSVRWVMLYAIVQNTCTFGLCWLSVRLTRRIIRPGYRNPLRYALATARIMMFCLFAILVSLLGYTDYVLGLLNILTGMTLMANPLWVSAFYFLSCDYPPIQPAPRWVPKAVPV